jgi:tryptophan synthase alpha subunit
MLLNVQLDIGVIVGSALVQLVESVSSYERVLHTSIVHAIRVRGID